MEILDERKMCEVPALYRKKRAFSKLEDKDLVLVNAEITICGLTKTRLARMTAKELKEWMLSSLAVWSNEGDITPLVVDLA